MSCLHALEVDWEVVEYAVMFVAVCGSIASAYVAMRKEKRGEDATWRTIADIQSDVTALKIAQEHSATKYDLMDHQHAIERLNRRVNDLEEDEDGSSE